MPETLQPTRFRRPNTQGRGDLLRQRFAEPRFGGSSQGTTPRRPLRETHSALLATYFVGPLIAGFRRLHPAIRFELGAGSWDLPSIENHDITLLSTNEGCDGGIAARRTLTVEAVLVASPACLARRRVPQQPQDLSDHAAQPQVHAAAGARLPRPPDAADAGDAGRDARPEDRRLSLNA